MAGVTVRESHVAEKRDGRLFVLESYPVDGKSGLDRMAPAIPVQMLLPLLREIQEAGMPPLRLCDARDAQPLKLHIEQSVDVRKIGGQSGNAQELNHLFADERAVPRIVVP